MSSVQEGAWKATEKILQISGQIKTFFTFYDGRNGRIEEREK